MNRSPLIAQLFTFQIVNFLLFLTLVHAQTTSSSRQIPRPDGVKSKRGLYGYEDALIGPPPPPPFHTIPYHSHGRGGYTPQPPPPNKWTNVFGFDDITYHSIYNELNGINYGIPTHMTPPPTALPSIFNNGYGYVNYGAAHDFDTSYIAHDGRVVKQYSVHERHHNDHPEPRGFRSFAIMPSQTLPAQSIPAIYTPPLNVAQPRVSFANSQQRPNVNQIPTFLNKNHGPVALGSGSLGFVRLPNGDVYLGSGSLGYISHKDHYDNVIDISSRRQKTHPRGPTTFGHAQQL